MAIISTEFDLFQAVQDYLMETGYPDYALSLNAFNAILPMNDGIGKVDPKNRIIFINPALSEEERSIVIRHEILHVMLKHHKRAPKKFNPQNWNIACDLEISNYYSAFDTAVMSKSDSKIGGGYSVALSNPEFKNMLAEAIYAALNADENKQENQQGGSGENGEPDESQESQEQQGAGDNGDNGDSEEQQGAGEEGASDNIQANEGGSGSGNTAAQSGNEDLDKLADAMESAVRADYNNLNEKEKETVKKSELFDNPGTRQAGRGVGTAPFEEIKIKISDAVKLKHDLHTYFIKQERLDRVKSYSRLNKKYLNSPFIFKGNANKMKPSKTLAIYLDISGSMDDNDRRRAKEILEGMKKIKNLEVVIKYFNNDVWDEGDKQMRLGGGTCYRNVFNDAARNKYSCIAIITDNSGERFPQSDKWDFEAVWVVSVQRLPEGEECEFCKIISAPHHKVSSPHVCCKKFMHAVVPPEK